MSELYWNERKEFLSAIRTGWCNEDYIEFLIDRVWKIKKPVKIIDFGCGLGYIGMLFMPLLPKGSTYTGIDISGDLLNEAEENFKGSGYRTTFIKADLNEYVPNEAYDIAISQAVLRHIPNAEKVLKKMIQSLTSGGLVICMETDLELEKAGHYFSGLDYEGLGLHSLYRKMYRKEWEQGGRDYRVATKIPIYMQELGLNNVGIRMNDSVKFINPNGEEKEYHKQLAAIKTAWEWNKALSQDEKVAAKEELISRGLNATEADEYINGQEKIKEYIKNDKNTYIIQTPCTLISYGFK